MNFEEFKISSNATVKDAIIRLNALSSNTMTLFVVGDSEVIIGTVTDGDIRRGIVCGKSLNSSIQEVMNRNFYYLNESKVEEISIINCCRTHGIKLLPRLDKKRRLVDVYDLKEIKSILPIDAVIMAGGKGERLRPLTNTVPKPLLKGGDLCIIDYNINNLKTHGVKNISVTVNYLAEQLDEHFSGSIVKTVHEPNFMGTMGAVQYVPHIENDTVLVMNSDLFTNIDLEKFYLHFIKNNADMSVAVVPYTVAVPFGIFELEGRDIKGVIEKPTYNYYANAGIYLIKRDVLLSMIPRDNRFDATDLIKKLIDNNKKLIRFPITGYWLDIGNKQDFDKAQEIARHLH